MRQRRTRTAGAIVHHTPCFYGYRYIAYCKHKRKMTRFGYRTETESQRDMARKPIFARLATEGRLKDNQSALFRWFLKHHDQFAAVLAKIARPGWQSIADELSAEGLTMKDGRPITAAYARVTWWRAHKSYEAKRLPRALRPSVPASQGGEVVHGVRPIVDEMPAVDDPPARPQRFAPASLRGHTPAPPPVGKPEPPPAPARQNPDEVIARLLGRKRADKLQPD